MSDSSAEQYTRCPQCDTVFRVSPAQLAARGGQVRCGHCNTVFDANVNALAKPASEAALDDGVFARSGAEPGANADDDTFSMAGASDGSPSAQAEATAQLERDAIADLDAAIADEALAEPREQNTPIAELRDDSLTSAEPREVASAAEAREAAEPIATEDIADVPAQPPPVAPRRRASRHAWNVFLALAIPVLLLLLIAQAAFHFRDAIASRWPETTPALNRMCEAAGCTLHPLHEIGYLSIEASDLQADPAHKGLLVLTATVRNRASYALAYPYLELTLTDSMDQVVVRRALAPKDYAGGTADLDDGIAANGELALKLFIDASATQQVGYRVYLFYP